MVRNDEMDALAALMGLGMLGSMISNNQGEGKHSTPGSSNTPKKVVLRENAKTMKELHDAYIEVGFTDEQAFELVKTVLSTKR